MPKISVKRKLKKLYQEIFVYDLLTLEICDEIDENKLKREDEIWEDFTLSMCVLGQVRYGCPFIHHSVPKSVHFTQNILSNLDDDRFRQIARVSKPSFDAILELIKNDEIFNGPRSCKQFSVEAQLIIVLYRLGSSGEGASISKIARLFGVSDGGVIQNMTNRVFHAILKLKTKFLYWPDAAERKILAAETFEELPHCVGYVDGTEVKLAEKPSEDPESYFSRKHMYSLKAQAICDYRLRIRHLVLGYPGSVHDARTYNNCSLTTRTTQMLTGAEWLAGDSAYKLSSTLITPFRSNSTDANVQQRNSFNKTFSKYRIRIEHCFGLLKERFNSLKELKLHIKNDSSVKMACRWILVCAVLHNILIVQRDESFEVAEENEYVDSEDGYVNNEDEPENHVSSHDGEAKRRALLSIILQAHS
ncbi:putative nuclease HARBI1 [Rhagoletis pomonella]|uniref:putative nuclease HARBI1 n=1 Tax=Rhagoletis pomonella TaxID=28610 RepID=UPI00177EA463|nr:putative nuclease HARBI1 [Rhagoletis pomonella]